jgi:hypothetical protein
MKTIIVAFWERNPGSDKDSDVFRLGKGVMPILKEDRAYPAIFNEKVFDLEKKITLEEKLDFIHRFIDLKFSSTNYRTIIVVLSETLKKDFFKIVRYHKQLSGKPEVFPSIPGEQFGDEDRIFFLVQDKEAYGPFPVRISIDPALGDPSAMYLVKKFGQINPN